MLSSLGFASAWGNVVGNDTQIFNPITSGIDFVTVQSTQTLDPGLANIGFFLSSAKNVLPATVNTAGKYISSQDTLTFTDLNLGYGLLNNMDIGLNISYLVKQDTSRNESGAQFSKAGLNEIRANGKINIFERRPIGLAMILSANLNQVKNNPFLGKSPGPTTNLELAADGVYGGNIFAANIGYRFRNSGVALDDSLYSPLASEMIASLGFSHYFPKYDLKLISEIYGSNPVSPAPNQPASFASEFLLGIKQDFSRLASLQAGLSRELSDGLFSPELRAYVGMNINLEIIPKTIVTVTQESAQKQALQMDVYSGFQPQDIAALASVPFDEITKSHEFSLRKAPPENIENSVKPPFEVFRLDGFDFAFGSSVIQDKYNPLLQSLIRYLNSEPKVIKARIEGHTDSVGTEDQNRKRSASRAEAVKQYLVKNGAHKDIEIESIGYGSQKPIADNSNYQGRQQNRRVEVRILRQTTAPEKKMIRE